MMHTYFYLLPVVLIAAIGTVCYWYMANLKRRRGRKKNVPEICMGAIRVTGRDGRDMVIVRKDDGSFEMMEEAKARKR